jgi:hypothetical protein
VLTEISLEYMLAFVSDTNVIRWVEHPFAYAAIRIRDRWYTTATEDNEYVEQVYTTRQLIRHLVDINTVPDRAGEWRDLRDMPF